MARVRPPFGGHIEIIAADALVAFHDELKAAPKPRHRPLDFGSAVLRVFIVQAVEMLRALHPRRKVDDDIVKQVGGYFGVSDSHVWAALKATTPEIRSAIKSGAAYNASLDRHLRERALARHRSPDLTRVHCC